jgi:hypothetical protein
VNLAKLMYRHKARRIDRTVSSAGAVCGASRSSCTAGLAGGQSIRFEALRTSAIQA